MFRSIRFRLTLWYTTIVVLTFFIVAWAVEEYVRSTLFEALDRSVSKELEWVVARYSQSNNPAMPREIILQDILNHIAYNPFKEYVEIWNSSSRIFYQSPNLVGDTLIHYISPADSGEWVLKTVRNFRKIELRYAAQRSSLGVFIVAMPTEIVSTPTGHLLRVLGWVGPIVVLVSVVSGLYLAKKSLSKVNQVIDAAEKITADRLYERLPAHNVQDEIGRLVSTLNEMIARLDRSFYEIRQFTADASHELRTPLSVIRSQLESALESNFPARQLKKTIANCLDETIHMTGIIENLLLLSKADAGQETIRREKVDLQVLVRQVYEDSVILASTKSIRVELTRLDRAKTIGDELRLRQMLLNLIDNAIKYSHKRGKIILQLQEHDGSARISVTDNGIGIPADEIPRIFNRFHRVDKARARETGGVGLGLAIAKWIAEAHGGTIAVSSEVNKGSEFTVELPLHRSH